MSNHDMLLGITPFLWLCGITAIILPFFMLFVAWLDKRDMAKIGQVTSKGINHGIRD